MSKSYYLALRTDNPQAELYLFDGSKVIEHKVWQAHRMLGETVHKTLAELLGRHNVDLEDLIGIVAYEGPGSFTGLRIGLSVANALAYSYGLPIAASTGEDWAQDGVRMLLDGQGLKAIVPHYGAPVHITEQRK